MKKVVLKYGLICALFSAIAFPISWSFLGQETDYTMGMVIGFSLMIIAFSTIFFAVAKHRSNQGGSVSFGQAFLIGLFITLMATTVYAASWTILTEVKPEIMDSLVDMEIERVSAMDLPQEELDAKLEETTLMMTSYKNNLVYRLLFTTIEIFPVGILISIISGLILSNLFRKKTQIAEA
jgi:hypothetical protein